MGVNVCMYCDYRITKEDEVGSNRRGTEWLSVRGTAVRLHRSYSQVTRLMEIGTLVGRRRDGRWWITTESVEQLARELGESDLVATSKES